MIQLNDIKGIAINPARIVYFSIDDNPMRWCEFSKIREAKTTQNKKGEDVTIVGEIVVMFQYCGYEYFQYHCADTLQQDYHTLLNATNA